MFRCDAIACQRVAHWLWRRKIPLVPRLIDVFLLIFWKCSIPRTVAIGAGTRIAYFQPGVVIHRRCVIGRNVELHGGVVIGGRREDTWGVPRIGDHVKIYSGAKILGDLEIGDGCVIAANAVVIESMPPGSIALPSRAQILSTHEAAQRTEAAGQNVAV
jgi:serine O-acetyltransferase